MTGAEGVKMIRRLHLLALGLFVALSLVPIARAQTYPTKPIRMVVGFPPAPASTFSAPGPKTVRRGS